MATLLTMKLGLFSARRATERARTEQATFEALVEPCWDALWRYAFRATGNADDAEDLLSETLIEGFRSFSQFRGDTPFARWMFRVMTTTRIDMVRKAARRKTESLDVSANNKECDTSASRDIADEDANPEAVIVGPMLSEPVQNALDALPEEFRVVIALTDMEQMDYAEVSRILQIPIGTVRSRLHRGRLLLRKSLAAYVEDSRGGTPL